MRLIYRRIIYYPCCCSGWVRNKISRTDQIDRAITTYVSCICLFDIVHYSTVQYVPSDASPWIDVLCVFHYYDVALSMPHWNRQVLLKL